MIISKVKSSILGIFFTNPDRSFYMGEIGRILSKKPGTFQRELESMVKDGMLTSVYSANARYFSLNPGYAFYSELKSIILKTSGAPTAIKEQLAGMKGIDFAFIYGSFASGKEHDMSDIDLFISGKPDEDMLIKKIDVLENTLKREINYKISSTNGLKKDIKEKDPFILNILKGKKIMIEGEEDELRRFFEGKPGKEGKA